MEPSLESIEEMFELVSAIPSEDVRDALMNQYRTELRIFLNKLERLYHRHYIKKHSVSRMESRRNREIAHFAKCLHSLLPLMVIVNEAHSNTLAGGACLHVGEN